MVVSMEYCENIIVNRTLKRVSPKTHRRFQFRDPIHFDSRVKRVSHGRLQNRARKFPWLLLDGLDVFKFRFGNGKVGVSIQVEFIIFFPYLKALELELR